MKKYQHIFFDLDRTLWDFEKSASQTFSEMYISFALKERGIPGFDDFSKEYKKNNDLLWSFYRKGEIKKEILSVKRFKMTLEEFGIKDEMLAAEMAEYYITISPQKVNLFPYTHEILSYLHKKYKLHLITNGFEEVQQKKLDLGDLRKYFIHIITSERAGVKKPEKGIFEYSFSLTGAIPQNSLMIGDDLKVDIQGAVSVNMDAMLVNYRGITHENNLTYEVNNLEEIRHIL
jgi:putative hydrolase of the HAD superfamily